MMRINQQLKPNGTVMNGADLPSYREDQKASIGREDGTQESNSYIGRVLIISGDAMVRDFLGQMLKLLGYDSQKLCEWPKASLEQLRQGFDAIFMEDQFLVQCGVLEEHRKPIGHVVPLIILLTSEIQADFLPEQQPGALRVLRKPLDYRQMGKIMDECFHLHMQHQCTQDTEDSSV